MSNQSLFPSNPIDESFGHYLSGFTDGEGSFSLLVGDNHGYPSPKAKFSIELRADDAPILGKIKDFLGCGSICFRDGPTRSNPMVLFQVQRIGDLAKVIIPNFERFQLRGKKAGDFAIWKQGVILASKIRNRRREGNGRGFYPKWTKSEQDQFLRLSHALKDHRKFRGL